LLEFGHGESFAPEQSGRSHDSQATCFSGSRQALVIRAQPGQLITNRVRCGQVYRVQGSQIDGQHGSGSVQDAVIESDYIYAAQHVGTTTNGLRSSREQGTSDLGSSQRACQQWAVPS
jgi:hypothetical protein